MVGFYFDKFILLFSLPVWDPRLCEESQELVVVNLFCIYILRLVGVVKHVYRWLQFPNSSITMAMAQQPPPPLVRSTANTNTMK